MPPGNETLVDRVPRMKQASLPVGRRRKEDEEGEMRWGQGFENQLYALHPFTRALVYSQYSSTVQHRIRFYLRCSLFPLQEGIQQNVI